MKTHHLLSIYLTTAFSSLSLSYVIFNKTLGITVPCPYGGIDALNTSIILLKNTQFAAMLFLLGFSRTAQLIVLCLAGIVSGALMSYAPPIVAFIGVTPHGVPEFLGYSLLALVGYHYFRHNKIRIRLIITGFTLITAAFFIEVNVTPWLIHNTLNLLGC